MIPELVKTHRVIAPDLPAHGRTAAPGGRLAERVSAWLGELIEDTCASPPALVGHVFGGALGARFAIQRGDRLSHLVLVDALGLARFRPSPRFALGFVGFVARPTERSYERFMRQCAFDLDELRERMGDEWEVFADYNLALARAPGAKAAGKLMRTLGMPPIPPEELDRIRVPTSLIWGRQDRANRLQIAEGRQRPLRVAPSRDRGRRRRPPARPARRLPARAARRAPQRRQIDRTTPDGVSVFPTIDGLFHYIAERGAEADGYATVEVEGELAGERDHHADAGALLIRPRASSPCTLRQRTAREPQREPGRRAQGSPLIAALRARRTGRDAVAFDT